MNEQHHKPIRSFVRREGKITKSQKQALTELLPEYGIELVEGEVIDFKDIFGREAPVFVEIGFGNGDVLCHLAKENPHYNYLGIEVYRPGVGSLLSKIAENHLSNVRVITQDAAEVFKLHIPDESLEGVMLFFPDPWHKKRHHKRRIVQPEFAEIISNKLKDGGKWYLSTDWENYALQMDEVLSSCAKLHKSMQISESGSIRVETKFEKRGKRLGHKVWDLAYIKSKGE